MADEVMITKEEAEVLSRVFGFMIEKKMNGTAHILNLHAQGKMELEVDPSNLQKRLVVYQSFLSKIGYFKNKAQEKPKIPRELEEYYDGEEEI